MVAAVLLVVSVVRLTSRSGGNQLSGATFTAGLARVLAPEADRHPILLQALIKDKDLYLTHTGADRTKGWFAFRATEAGAPRRCTLTWDAAAQLFRDTSCGSPRTYPVDGTGLERYTVTVDAGGKVVIDLRTPG